MTQELFQNYVQQNVPKDVQEFIFVELNNGVPSNQVLYTFLMNPGIKAKVLTLFRTKQARKIKLANLREQNCNPIVESAESQEQSSQDFHQLEEKKFVEEEEKEGFRMPIMNKSIQIDVENLINLRISDEIEPDSFRL